MARKKEISAKHVERLAAKFWKNTEIAAFFDVDEGTIRKRFSEELRKGREFGCSRLRDKQLHVAMDGNVVMLIWLGKQYLGQTEKMEAVIGEELINNEIRFSSVPGIGDGKERFARFIN